MEIATPALPSRTTPATTLAWVGLAIAVFGPMLLWSNTWHGGRSIFKFAALMLGASIALAGFVWMRARGEMPALRASERQAVSKVALVADVAMAFYATWVLLAALVSEQPLLGLSGVRPYWDGAITALAIGSCYAVTRVLATAIPSILARRLITLSALTSLALMVPPLLAYAGVPNSDVFIRYGRVGSLVGQPTFLAAYCAMWLPLLSASAFSALRTGQARRSWRLGWRQAAAIAGTIAAVLLLAATQSRAGWVAAAAGIALYAVLAAKTKRTRIITLCVSVALVAVMAGAALALRDAPAAGDSGDATATTRAHAYAAALHAAAEHPLFGTGPGTFGSTYLSAMTPRIFLTERDKVLLDAHDWYLNAASTTGIPAGLAALAIAFSGLAAAWVRRGSQNIPLAAACGAVTYSAHVLLTPNSIATSAAALVLLAVAVSAPPRPGARVHETPAWQRYAPSVLAVLVALAMTSWGVRLLAAELSQGSSEAAGNPDGAALAARLAPEVSDFQLERARIAMISNADPAAARRLIADAEASPTDSRYATRAGTLLVAVASSTPGWSDADRSAILDAAVSLLERGARLRPEDPRAQADLARGLAAAGETKRAQERVEWLRNALGPNDPLLLELSGILPQP